jgi:hypothetical protein
MTVFNRLLIIIALTVSCVSCCHAPSEPHGLSSARPIWTVDLRAKGYSSDPFTTSSAPEAARQIAFGSNDELVIIKDSGSFANPNNARAFVLGTKSGDVQNEVHWVTNKWPYIFATTQGNYAVVANDGMILYSRGLKGIVATAADVAANEGSPDGHSLAAWKTTPGHGLTYFLNADTLRPTGTQFLDTNVESISPDAIAYIARRKDSTTDSVFVNNGKSAGSRYDTKCEHVQARFVSANVLTIVGCDLMEVVTEGGAKLFAEPVSGGLGYTGFAAASRSGNRIAIRQTFDKPGDPSTICTERITIFDVNSRKAVLVADVQQLHGFDFGPNASGIALSPDGSFMAVNSAGVVQLYQLPK